MAAERSARQRQRLSGVSEQRVLATGILHLHEELVVRRSAQVLQLPVRANGTPRVLQGSFFRRLLGGQIEFKSCMESDVSSAQSDLRYLSPEQLLAIRAATSDFHTESASHSAHRNFLATVDVHLFGKLARQALRGGVEPPERPEALHKLGFHMALMVGAAELLAAGWGNGGGGDEELPPPDCWLVRLDVPEWPDCGFALFRASELSIEVLAGKHPDIAAAAAGSRIAVLNDQTVDMGVDRTLNWEVSFLDPSVEDVLAEVALLQRSPRRPSALERRSSSAPCAKRPPPAAASAAWPAAQAEAAGCASRRLEDLPRLLSERNSVALRAPKACEAKGAPPVDGLEGPPLSAAAPQEGEGPGSFAAAEAMSGELASELPEAPALWLAEVPRYLRAYGYRTLDGASWQGWDLPTVRISVSEHAEADGHTQYVLDCELRVRGGREAASAGSPAMAWKVGKRLLHLRKGLHDLVKRGLGEAEYGRLFGSSHFARHMGLPGTTNRLSTWCQTLAGCMSTGWLGPTLVAEVLRFLDAPSVASGAGAPADCVPPLDRAAAEGALPTGSSCRGQPARSRIRRARSIPIPHLRARAGRA